MSDYILQKLAEETELNLAEFLSTKEERAKEFDPSRFPTILKNKHFDKAKKTIQLIGTNGKGTTGRLLAVALNKLGHSVFHFTSPHLLNINERFWLNGFSVTDSQLDFMHNATFNMLDDLEKTKISYFEYCTLIAANFAQNCDYAIFEAGMGGEFDATTSLDIDIVISTTIDFDHTDTLGDTIQKIALTKFKAAKNCLFIGKQNYHDDVWKTTNFLNPSIRVYNYELLLSRQDILTAKTVLNKIKLAENPFIFNVLLSFSVLRFLGFNINSDLFNAFDLQGRSQKINENTWIDVGHNPTAAKEICKNFKPHSMRVVFGCAKDKDATQILNELKQIASHIEFFEYKTNRNMPIENLEEIAKKLNIKTRKYSKQTNDPTLVFGSFELISAYLTNV